MVRVRPRARDLITEEEYLKLAMTSPMNNCPGGIGPILRKRYAMDQRAKKEEAARRKEKRKKGRNKKKKEKENMDSETPDEKLDSESKTPNEQQPFIGPEYVSPELAKRLERAAVLIKELEAGNDTFDVVTELVVVENIIEKMSLYYEPSNLFPYNRVTPSDYSALRSKYRLSF